MPRPALELRLARRAGPRADLARRLQVVCLGMTTNEQLNRGRYRHFQARGGRSPFSRGPLNNCADFFEWRLCGLLAPRARDWAEPDADGDDAPMLPDPRRYV